MPSRGRNCHSLFRLKLISRSPIWLVSNIVAFYPGGPSLIPINIKLYFVPNCQSNIIHHTRINIIHIINTYMYILLQIYCNCHRSFNFGQTVLSTDDIF